jgi:hypothetical protein
MLEVESDRGCERFPRPSGGILCGDHQVQFVGLSATVLTHAAAFFFIFSEAGLVAAVDLSLGFLGPAVFLVTITLGCLGASVTGCEEGFGLGVEWWSGLDDTPPSDGVIPSIAQVHLHGRGPGPLRFRSGGAVCSEAISGTLGCLLFKVRPSVSPLYTALVFRLVISSTATKLGLFPRCRAPPERCKPPHAKFPGAYPQLRFVCPKRWQSLHCGGHLGAMYDTTETR